MIIKQICFSGVILLSASLMLFSCKGDSGDSLKVDLCRKACEKLYDKTEGKAAELLSKTGTLDDCLKRCE